jgi:formamidopyrimidine-DNA glycosylase
VREGQAERNMVEDENRYIDRQAAGELGQEEIGLEAPTCLVCGEDLEYEVVEGIGGYFCPYCRECEQTGKGI